jgi:hypothetical protein
MTLGACSGHPGDSLPNASSLSQAKANPNAAALQAKDDGSGPFVVSTAKKPVTVAKIIWGKAPSATAGTPFSTEYPPKIKVIAETADGKVIRGLYANPIRLLSSDKSGAVQVQINGGNIGPKQIDTQVD